MSRFTSDFDTADEVPEDWRDIFVVRECDQMFHPSNRELRWDSPDADAFFKAALRLLNDVVHDRIEPDIYGPVAVHLARHATELALKTVLARASRFENDETNKSDHKSRVVKGHDLDALFKAVATLLKERTPGILETGYDLDFVGAFVSQLHHIDPKGFAFRYEDEWWKMQCEIDYQALHGNVSRLSRIMNYLSLHQSNQYFRNQIDP